MVLKKEIRLIGSLFIKNVNNPEFPEWGGWGRTILLLRRNVIILMPEDDHWSAKG